MSQNLKLLKMKKISMKCIQVIFLIYISVSFSQSEINTEDFLIYNDSIQLPGTLTYNKSLKKQPLAIFIHGSGNVDRNGNQAGLANANYIKLLSEALNKNNIAFCRYDKRTSTRTNMKFLIKGMNFNSFVEDAQLVLDKFKNDKRFSKITIIGHSQGSLVGMLISKNGADKYISLAGPANSIDKAMVTQIRQQSGDSIANIVSNHFKELKTKGKIENVDPNLFSIFNPINQNFFGSWLAYNPKEEIRKLAIPTLIINGTKDLQVFESDAKALHTALPNSELKLIKNMNHVLKNITKDEDNLKSYRSPDFELSQELAETIIAFIKK